MVQRATKFIPQVLLSAPRRSAGVPNPSGTTVLHTTSTYSFETHKKYTELNALNVETGAAVSIIQDKEASNPTWLDDETFVCFVSEKDGETSLRLSRVPWGGHAHELLKEEKGLVGTIDAPASDLKIVKLDVDGNDFGVVYSAQASPDGSLFNSEKAKKTQSTGKLYSGLYARHWDRWETKEKSALFHAKLSRSSKDSSYQLSKGTNILKDTGLESPIPPFGGSDNFDVGVGCVVFTAKDPDLNPALNTKTSVYIVYVDVWDSGEISAPQKVIVPGYEGASTSPALSPDGRQAAFLAMKTDGYEADRNQIFVLPDIREKYATAFSTLSPNNADESWNRSPSSVRFTADSRSLLLTAEDYGYSKLFMITPSSSGRNAVPRVLTSEGSVSDVKPLVNGTIFISGTTLVDNSFYAILDPKLPPSTLEKSGSLSTWTSSNSAHGNKFGLNHGQVSSIWTPASNTKINEEVHSWVIKPSNFDKDKKYPVAYLIHGGPQGSWADNWSTRWNPAVFAEQGYIVVAPNPTGSTGYGQEFTDAIKQNWGGDPYQDIVNCFEWVGKNMPEADNDRAVALGASFGGYMMNWIQGHDLGRKFKALVCHDGILSMAGMLATEELYFPFRDIGGTPWYHPSTESTKSAAVEAHHNFGTSTFSDWRKWDPSEHFSNWSTPELIIHSSNDYRICIADGLAAFNVLQARGVESELLTFPDENHFVLKPENSLVWHKVVLNWINKYVGLPAFTDEDPNSDAFWGGTREEKEEVVEMEGQGKPET